MFHSSGTTVVNPTRCYVSYVRKEYYTNTLGDSVPTEWNDGVYMERNDVNGKQGLVLVSTERSDASGEVLVFYRKEWKTVVERVKVGAKLVGAHAITTRGEAS